MRIGEAVANKYGLVDQIERSPYKRTRQTAEHIANGSAELVFTPSSDNPYIRERGFGDADIYPVACLYFVDNPQEYQAMQAYSPRYSYPKAERRVEWKNRMKRQARRYKTAKVYDGKTTLVVAHSRAIGNQIEFLTQPSWFERRILGRPDTPYKDITVSTGSITVLEEYHRNRITGRRRYQVVSLDERVA
jgi:broad specificity phosphatase PhoE